MKTVSGKVVSSQSLSLSKASKYLARFSASDNEVSPALGAYLKRTNLAFYELAQLHKKYKIPLDQIIVKEDHSEGVVTQTTSNSTKFGREGVVSGKGRKRECGNGSEGGLSIGKGSKDVSMKSSGDNSYGNVADGGGDGKKSKKKSRREDGNVVANGVSDAINVVEGKNEMGSADGSEDLKKKKKERGKHEKQNNDPVLESRKDVQRVGGVGNVGDTARDNGDAQVKDKKKSKSKEGDGNSMNKVKEEREHSSIKSVEHQRGDINDGNVDETSDKKHKKKRSHEAGERVTGHKVETETVDVKASKKRKHEKVEDGGLDASPESVRSKKKKHKH